MAKYNVTLDTCVFFKEHNKHQTWQMNQATFKGLIDLCDGDFVQLVMSDVVIREATEGVIPRISRDIAGSHAASIAALNGEPMSADQISEALITQFQKLCGQAEIVTVEGVSAASVLDLYFGGAAPFSKKKKKEFPDAFAILSLRSWAAKHGRLHVVSPDPDWIRACTGDLVNHKTLEDLQAFILSESGDSASAARITHAMRSALEDLKDHFKRMIDMTAEADILSRGRRLRHDSEYSFEARSTIRSYENCSVYGIREHGKDGLLSFSATADLQVRVTFECDVDNPELDDNPAAPPTLEIKKVWDGRLSLHAHGEFDPEGARVTLDNPTVDDEVRVVFLLERPSESSKWVLRSQLGSS